MIMGKPAPFVRTFIDAVDQAIRQDHPDSGLSAIQRSWLAFCVTATLVTHSICWARFERASLGTYSMAALSWMFRHSKIPWERLHDLTAELVRLKMDVIVANARGVRATQHATRTIPIVMTGQPDPVADGFVASLARPGGNITGLSNMSGVLFEKRLELLKETRPQSTRIAVLFNTALDYTGLMHTLTVGAQALKLHLHVAALRSAED